MRKMLMTTVIRQEISENNKYWIDKHLYYKLKHFWLKYPFWKKECAAIDGLNISSSIFERIFSSNNTPGDPTVKQATIKAYYSEKIDLIEKAAI